MKKKILKYIKDNFNFSESVYHKDFRNKDNKNIIVSLCVGGLKDSCYIRIYENTILKDEINFREGKINIDVEIDNIDDEIKRPNLKYIYEILVDTIDKYNKEEILSICFSEFPNVKELENDIIYIKKELENKKQILDIINKYLK